MKRFNHLLLAVSLTLVTVLLVLGNSSGPAANDNYYTGAPSGFGGTESTCDNCHSGGIYGEPAITTLFILDGTPVENITEYVPGATYDVSVSVAGTGDLTPGGFGFSSIFLQDADNAPGGTPSAPVAGAQISDGAAGTGRKYVEQASVSNDGIWSFKWTAPAAGAGSVNYYVSGNLINEDGFTSGDNGSTSPTIITLAEGALPVELTAIKASVRKSNVDLTWRTATEDNVSHFAVERATDGTTFVRIDRVAATGFSADDRNYHYTDESAPLGENFYRLRMVDLDETFAYSPVVSARVDRGAASLTLYPNPANDHVSFLGFVPEGAAFRLLDGAGRTQRIRIGTDGLDISTLKAGIYYLETTIDGQRTIQRLIKP